MVASFVLLPSIPEGGVTDRLPAGGVTDRLAAAVTERLATAEKGMAKLPVEEPLVLEFAVLLVKTFNVAFSGSMPSALSFS